MAKNHYVNNKQLLEAMRNYKEITKDFQERLKKTDAPLVKPQIPRYVAESILLIANKLATKGNFSGYSYKEEMIGDAVENVVKYIDSFDPYKYDNPLAYFTQIIKFAFIRRIKKEKKQHAIKVKNMQRLNLDCALEYGNSQDQFEINEINNQYLIDFEESVKKKPVKTGIEKFVSE